MTATEWEWVEKTQHDNKQLKSAIEALLKEIDRLTDLKMDESKAHRIIWEFIEKEHKFQRIDASIFKDGKVCNRIIEALKVELNV